MAKVRNDLLINAVYFLVGREGRDGIAASDIQAATGYSKPYVNRILHKLMRLGVIYRVEHYPDEGRPYFIYKDSEPIRWASNSHRLSRDYEILCIVRGVTPLGFWPHLVSKERNND